MTPLLEEYFGLLERHGKELKTEVLLLMQVGSFNEAFEIDEPKRGCAKKISDVLRMHLTKKNGNKTSNENNPWMVGFPTYVLSKHLSKLNDEGYTVAIYEQNSENNKERILKGIYNSIIRYENDDELLNDNREMDRKIYGLIIDKYKHGNSRIKSHRFLLSFAYGDIQTGQVGVYEQESADYHREYITDCP